MLNPGWLDAAYLNMSYAWPDYIRHQAHNPNFSKGKFNFSFIQFEWLFQYAQKKTYKSKKAISFP